MKYLFSSLLLITLSLSAIQAQVQVPSNVNQQFELQYPTVENPHWEYREGAIVAMFQLEGLLTKAFYEKNGSWRETRTRIDTSNLPVGVNNFLNTNYKEANYTYVGRVETNDGDLFRIESEFRNSVIIKTLTPEGQLVQEEWINYSLMDQEVTAPLPSIRPFPVKETPK
ncbi:hypothetical protein [Lewinella cohaerens]|uniref:hypothetical protein n=1 Tax=Lewinella cohaerens TaxID=70995 RepID=UPI00037E2E96|nr:hypothetical protein [Lewinella cohaerens]